MQAPSYTSVAARRTLQPSAPKNDTPKPNKTAWSAEVRAYVQRAFEQGNAIPDISQAAMQEKLKVIISAASDVGQLDSTNWSIHPLPQHIIKQERDQAALYGTQQPTATNMTGYGSPQLDGAYFPQGPQSKKRKSADIEMTDPNQALASPPAYKMKNMKSSLEDRITKPKQEKKQKKADNMRLNALASNKEALERRRQRFGVVSPEPNNAPARDFTPSFPATGPVVGTCQTLEKDYFRLTAPPNPEVVRPILVLEQALDLIRKKWKKEHNYSYACNQLKSMRQDLTVQHVKNDFTVKTYEVHARIALEMGDLGEYNQCQTQLRALYKTGLGGNPEEFMAYRILYFIYTRNQTDMNSVLADLTPADKQKPGVRHALQVRAALASGNYHKFFRLYADAPFMGPYLLDMFVQRERIAALAVICRSYKPDLSVKFLTHELAFDCDVEGDAAIHNCLEFFCQHGGQHLLERKDDDVRFASGKAGLFFENAKAAGKRVDIKGQI